MYKKGVSVCVVCGETSEQVALHYGRNLCNGCRAFFKRTIQGGEKLAECKRDGNCVVDHTSRKACKSCRYEACLRAGVDKSKVQQSRDDLQSQGHSQQQQHQQQQLQNNYENDGGQPYLHYLDLPHLSAVTSLGNVASTMPHVTNVFPGTPIINFLSSSIGVFAHQNSPVYNNGSGHANCPPSTSGNNGYGHFQLDKVGKINEAQDNVWRPQPFTNFYNDATVKTPVEMATGQLGYWGLTSPFCLPTTSNTPASTNGDISYMLYNGGKLQESQTAVSYNPFALQADAAAAYSQTHANSPANSIKRNTTPAATFVIQSSSNSHVKNEAHDYQYELSNLQGPTESANQSKAKMLTIKTEGTDRDQCSLYQPINPMVENLNGDLEPMSLSTKSNRSPMRSLNPAIEACTRPLEQSVTPAAKNIEGSRLIPEQLSGQDIVTTPRDKSCLFTIENLLKPTVKRTYPVCSPYYQTTSTVTETVQVKDYKGWLFLHEDRTPEKDSSSFQRTRHSTPKPEFEEVHDTKFDNDTTSFDNAELDDIDVTTVDENETGSDNESPVEFKTNKYDEQGSISQALEDVDDTILLNNENYSSMDGDNNIPENYSEDMNGTESLTNIDYSEMSNPYLNATIIDCNGSAHFAAANDVEKVQDRSELVTKQKLTPAEDSQGNRKCEQVHTARMLDGDDEKIKPDTAERQINVGEEHESKMAVTSDKWQDTRLKIMDKSLDKCEMTPNTPQSNISKYGTQELKSKDVGNQKVFTGTTSITEGAMSGYPMSNSSKDSTDDSGLGKSSLQASLGQEHKSQLLNLETAVDNGAGKDLRERPTQNASSDMEGVCESSPHEGSVTAASKCHSSFKNNKILQVNDSTSGNSHVVTLTQTEGSNSQTSLSVHKELENKDSCSEHLSQTPSTTRKRIRSVAERVICKKSPKTNFKDTPDRKRRRLYEISQNEQLEDKPYCHVLSTTLAVKDTEIDEDVPERLKRRLGTQFTSTPIIQGKSAEKFQNFDFLMCGLASLFKGESSRKSSLPENRDTTSQNSDSPVKKMSDLHTKNSSAAAFEMETEFPTSEQNLTPTKTRDKLENFKTCLIVKINDEAYTMQQFKQDIFHYMTMLQEQSDQKCLELDESVRK